MNIICELKIKIDHRCSGTANGFLLILDVLFKNQRKTDLFFHRLIDSSILRGNGERSQNFVLFCSRLMVRM